ncbi:MAG: radical SAM protein, partial [Patescibacteria group bacterium]|nr:radical SAM protein [Patescibacteria group bacterium]
ILDEVKLFSPDLAIVHTTTPSIYNDIEYARKAKKLTKCRTVLVGAHATAVPEDTLKKGGHAVDMIARAEADYTLRDIAKDLPLKDILGISYVKKGKIIHNSDRPHLDVNELPFPAWKQIDPHWYHDAGKLYPFLTMYTGRGCFGLCTFCREPQVMNGRKLRMRDAKKVVDEMEYDLKLFPDLREIMFETDTFTAVPHHVKDVCEEIIQRDLHKRISWSCNVRVDVKLDLLPLMKKAGCRMLMVGFEFGTNEQLASVKKGTNIETSRKFAEAADKLGFTTHGCFMIGAPGETPTSAQKTIDFAKSLPLDTIQISGIAVYPGTELYDWAKKHDYIKAKDWTDWVDENHEQVTLLSYPQMSKSMIDFYIDKGLKEFYLQPKQIVKMLFAIRSWDDIRRKLYGLIHFLDYFKKNKRKNIEDCSNNSSPE